MVRQVKKSFLWKLSLFAASNYTTIGYFKLLDYIHPPTIYYPQTPATGHILAHEQIHIEQFRQVGTLKFLFLYLFIFPFIWNPWRYTWEYQAYVLGSNYSIQHTKKILRSSAYGWLICH